MTSEVGEVGGQSTGIKQLQVPLTKYSFSKSEFLFAIIFCSLLISLRVPISCAVQVVQPVHLEISLCLYTCAFLVSNLGMNMLLEKL